MALYKRASSPKWQYRFKFQGRQHKGSCKTTNKRLAQEYENQVKADVYKGKFLRKKKKLTLDILWQLALEKYPQKISEYNKLRGFRLDPNTKKKIPCARLEYISVSGIFGLVRAREREGIQPTTIEKEIIALRQAIQYAQDLGYFVPSNLRFPKLPKPKRKPIQFLTVDQVKSFLKELDPKREQNGLPQLEDRSSELQAKLQSTYDLAVLLLCTAGRFGEIAGLKWEQVDLLKKTIRLYRPKVGNESILYMAQPAEEVLNRRKKSVRSEYVFPNSEGNAKDHDVRAFKKAFQRARIKVSQPSHILRKTAASLLVQNGMDLYAVSKILGHSSIRTTERTYAHLAPQQASLTAANLLNRLPLLGE